MTEADLNRYLSLFESVGGILCLKALRRKAFRLFDFQGCVTGNLQTGQN